ncbi:phosphatidylglycerophosphatase A [Rhodobacter sp. SGA-6-6]|uniref:phosphatidylglycerophosphatase A family protein n=1 Tax=Rhodobacter sp. SGA-6-6 TaxID=2710882 RepID=UPI0013EAE6DD|nr:phosphatidylglycerophosphatase A [Rhodobacter sp. SGA-6-6]NGM47034.1 phosphatidylglycerophosphatase A [Rhodobacter sp. SGA-6-6]
MMRQITTVCGLGLLRPAPGTWASAAAALLGWGAYWLAGLPLVAALAALAVLAGFRAVAAELAGRPGEDPSEIVIDEVAGMLLALAFPAAAFWLGRGWEGWLPWPAVVFPFLFFRLFDIWKPWLVGRADRRGDVAGVMLDDLWAGLFAGLASVAAAILYHVPLALMAGP